MKGEPATGTLVLQAWAGERPRWIGRCLASAERWARQAGHGYRLLDDALFDPVPGWFAEACGAERLPVTDLARLLWMRRLHGEGSGQVVWLDADVLILAPERFAIDADDAFCQELWMWRGTDGALAAHWRVSNCAMAFAAGSALLDAYIAACERLVRERSGPIERIALGPRLLTRLAEQAPLPLITSVATLSPLLVAEAAAGGGSALTEHRRLWAAPVQAAHLCHSLGVDDATVEAAIDRLLAERGLLGE